MKLSRVRALILLCGALVAVQAFGQSVYRCKDAKGQTVFQQAPCIDQVGAPIPASVNVIAGPSAGDQRARLEAERNIQMRANINTGRVAVGMTENELVQSWGQPLQVNTDYVGTRVSKQWVYRRPGYGDQYVYTDDGLVTGIQDRPNLARRVERCYTSDEIRNERVGANSITLSFEEKNARLEAIAKMRPC